MQLEPPRRRLVLVVDDEEVLRVLLRRQLGRAGYEVLLAGSGQEALDLLTAHPDVDLILTDVRMPGGSGLELVSRLDPRDRPAIVFMSGASTVPRAALLTAGGRAFLKKPFRMDELLAAIERGFSASASRASRT